MDLSYQDQDCFINKLKNRKEKMSQEGQALADDPFLENNLPFSENNL